jgi:predicted NUDIX family phosphoesterase
MAGLDEKILCVKEETLFKDGKWQGLKAEDLEKYKKTLLEDGEYRLRRDLEEDPSYKQVIAQVILRYKDKYFLHKQAKRNEKRLNGFNILPLGGHIEDIDEKTKGDTIEIAMDRELHEEVELNAKILKKEFLGLIYIEDENPVNTMHVGLFYVYDLDSMDVQIKEEGLENIGFVSLDYLKTNSETLTFWSRVIIYHL